MPEELLYGRQQQIHLDIPASVTIAGVGGVGFWMAVDMAMSGVPTLYLFDPDVVEESNRNRLPFCQGSVGRPKVEATKDFILAIRQDAIVVAIQDKLEGVLLGIQLQVCSLIMDGTDSPRAQIMLYNLCKERGHTYIRCGYDGTRFTVTSTVSGWIKCAEEEQYVTAPSWVVPAQVAAALAVGKALKYHNQEVSLDLEEIGIPLLKKQQRLTKRCGV